MLNISTTKSDHIFYHSRLLNKKIFPYQLNTSKSLSYQNETLMAMTLRLKAACYTDGPPESYLYLPPCFEDSRPSQDNNRQI